MNIATLTALVGMVILLGFIVFLAVLKPRTRAAVLALVPDLIAMVAILPVVVILLLVMAVPSNLMQNSACICCRTRLYLHCV